MYCELFFYLYIFVNKNITNSVHILYLYYSDMICDMGLKWTRLNPSLLGSCPVDKSISPQLICNWKCHSLLIALVNNFLVFVRSPVLKPEWANGSTTRLCLSDNHHEKKVILLLFIASTCSPSVCVGFL